MPDYLPDTPCVARAYCPGCEPDADPSLEILDVRWCESHSPVRDGTADEAVNASAYLSGSAEAGGEDSRRWQNELNRIEFERRVEMTVCTYYTPFVHFVAPEVKPWIIAFDGSVKLPYESELKRLSSYREFVVLRTYESSQAREILALPFSEYEGHDTTVFQIRSLESGIGHNWFYRKASWGPDAAFVPDEQSPDYRAVGLVELLDSIQSSSLKEWEGWKKENHEIFKRNDGV